MENSSLSFNSIMKLVTVATHAERYFPYLKVGAEKHKYNLVVLGWGEKWRGFVWRFQLLKNYLKSLTEDEVICFIDAYDVLLLKSAERLEQKFHSMTNGDKTKIVISKDTLSSNPVHSAVVSWLQSLAFKQYQGHYINAGTYIGYSSAILKVLEDIEKTFELKDDFNDQAILQEYAIQTQDKFIVDRNNSLFFVINNPLGKLDIRELNKHSCILHGPGFTNLDEAVLYFGYDPFIFRGEDETMVRFNYITTNLIHYAKEFIRKWNVKM
jgi:hypothetical protein